MREKVESKLKELEDPDVIEKVEGSTPWVSALVPIPKSNNDIRLCVDMRCANKAIQRERFPLPNIDETLEQINGASVFSKLDLAQAFRQVELESDSRFITTFATNNGLYRYERLFFGVNSAPETYQRIIQQVIQDIPGCKNIIDDIIIYASNQQEHDKILRMLLTRLREKGLTLNRNKCEFNKSELKFMAHTLSNSGIKIADDKVKAVKDTPPPTNPSEVKSFLGLINFCSKFIKNLATIAESLRKLTRKDVAWHWGQEQQNAFETLKQCLISSEVIAYYNQDAETQLIVDGSPYELGAILNQKQRNGEFKPVAYASRTLNPVERRYSQIERESLATLWAIQRLRVYLFGMNLVVYTDHKPLERIFTSSHDAPARIQKWILKLQPYTFSVKYIKGGCFNPSDILSRATTRKCNEFDNKLSSRTEQYITGLTESTLPVAITLQEIKTASEQDKLLAQVRKCLQTNRWQKQGNMKPYFQVRNKLSVKDSLVLKGNKLVIPKQLQTRILDLAHESHRGLKKTKQLLKSKVWFPNIDAKVEDLIKSCNTCQLTSTPTRAPPVVMNNLPAGPWKKIGLDLSGPYGSNNEFIFAAIDYYSRFPMVEIIKSTTSTTIINRLRQIFAMHGFVDEIVTDNASYFVSSEFKAFLHENGIKHSRISPYWSRNNGLVENFNKSIRKAVRTELVQNKNWRTEIYKFLLHYRATEHTTTEKAPAQLLYNRQIKTKLPQFDNKKSAVCS